MEILQDKLIAYSFTISYISNYIIKSNKKSMTFEKHLEILQEIKIHHPSMRNSLYNEVLRNIYNEQLYERKDKHLLFDCLPYSLKNKLIVEMYKPLIKNLVFFKDTDNSDFIVKVVTSLKPLISVKGDIVIAEGDYIKEIIFVKKGVIGLNISINLEDPEFSLKKYFGNNTIGKFDVTYIKSNIIVPKKTFEDTSLNNIFNKSEETMFYHNENFEDIKIIEIRKNEHFGDALMFLNERCPMVAKVRTKTAELLILRKIEAIEIYSIYPNIWKRINKKSLFNMEQIYHKIKKVVIELSSRYKVNIDSIISRKKTKNKKISNININGEENNDDTDKKEMEVDEPKEKEEIEDFKQEQQPQKIIEFNENMNNINNNISINLNASITNMIENITFLKKNSSLKDTILSLAANDLLKKNSVFKNTLLSKQNNLNISRRSIKSKKSTKSNRSKISNRSKMSNRSKRSNRSIRSIKPKRIKMSKTKTTSNDVRNNYQKANPKLSKSFIKFTGLNPFNSNNMDYTNENKNNTKKHSSIFPNMSLTNNSKMSDTNNSDSSIDIRSSFQKSPKKEKIFYSSFTNLTTTQENNFQLNSSYDNINKISNNKYIKDINLQTKIKQVLMNECLEGNVIKKKNTFLQLPGMTRNMNSLGIPKSSNKASSRELGNVLSEIEFDNLNNYPSQMSIAEEKDDFSKNSTLINKSCADNCDGIPKMLKKDQKSSSGKLLEIKKANKMISSNSIFDLKKVRTPMLESRKPIKKKKKKEKINKQLNIISKNIETTSRNINNPGEFYMNFFNNIIAKESKSMNGEDDSQKNNILSVYAGSKLKDSQISGESNNNSQSNMDSFSPSKENKAKEGNISNMNSNSFLKLDVSIKKSKTKQKSSFK